MEDLIKFDKSQAFKYCSALNKIEKLPAIWGALTGSEKNQLWTLDSCVVGYRASEIVWKADFNPESSDRRSFLCECLRYEWEDAYFGLYNTLDETDQKFILLNSWVSAVLRSERSRHRDFVYDTLRKQLKRKLIFDDEDKQLARDVLAERYCIVFPEWKFKNLPEDCEIELFDNIMMELSGA